MYKHVVVAMVVLCGLLAGCVTAPAAPYWSNADWIDQLGASVQTQLAESRAVADVGRTVGNVAVGFTYRGGALLDVHIIQSTGSPALDSAIKAAVEQVRPPPAGGPWSDTAHSFALALFVGSGWTALTRDIHLDIQQHADYPVAAMLSGAGGVVVARFAYLNGRALDPRIIQSSGYADIDRSVINELRALELPAPPPELRNRRLTFQSTICFNHESLRCPRGTQSVYYVANTAAAQPCSEVAFRYRSGKISDVRLARATQYPSLDKLALRLVTQGEFPSPAVKLASSGSLMIPVCYTFNLESPDTPSTPEEQNRVLRDLNARHAAGMPFRPVPVDVGRTQF